MKNSSIRIFLVLLSRDLKVMRYTIVGELIDAFILLVIQLITFGKLFPLIGMPVEFTAPLFIGSGLFYIFLTRGYSSAMILSYKIPTEGFGNLAYHSILPLSIWWVFAEYITYFVIETSIITMPMFFIGIKILQSMIHFPLYSWFFLVITYALTLIVGATYFLGCAYLYSFEWFRDNLWARRIEPLMSLSSLYFPWITLYAFSPLLGIIALFNPITIMVEGMRTALLGDSSSLPLSFCIPMMLVWIFCSFLRLRQGIKKSLDPVL
jgi:hypothetical protein